LAASPDERGEGSLWGWAPLTWPDRSVDLDVAAAELVVAGVVAIAQADPVVVVRAGLAVVDDVDLVTDRGRSVERRLTEDARFRRTRARDRDDAGRVHVRGFRRPMVCVLLLAAGGAARALRIAAEVGLVIVIGRDLAAVRDLGFAVRRRRGPRLRRGVARLARILRAAVVQVGVRADRVVAGRDSLVA